MQADFEVRTDVDNAAEYFVVPISPAAKALVEKHIGGGVVSFTVPKGGKGLESMFRTISDAHLTVDILV